MSRWIKYLFILTSLLCTTLVQAQTKEELQDKQEALADEIKLTNALLQAAKQEKNQSVNTLSTLKRQIAARGELINTLGIEIDLYTNRIQTLLMEVVATEEAIKQQQEVLAKLKEEYAQMIYSAYTNKGANDRLAFIFSAHSFHQAYKRIRYLQQYSQFRKQQAELIIAQEEELAQELLSLKQQKALLAAEKVRKTNSLSKTQKEQGQLAGEKEAEQGLLNNLQKRERKLKQDLQAKERKAKALETEIRAIIAEEIRKAKDAAKSTGTASFSMTPEQKQLAAHFTANKSKLPWPVERGVITEGFGRRKHPVLAGIETFNNGVKITTEKGSAARAVFEGTVSRIINIPGAGKAIILSHGDYFSVYSNLSDVFVKAGQSVSTKQEIGMVLTNTNTKETITELQIWKGNEKLDPAQWLYRAY